jgi:hypothetical protein
MAMAVFKSLLAERWQTSIQGHRWGADVVFASEQDGLSRGGRSAIQLK